MGPTTDGPTPDDAPTGEPAGTDDIDADADGDDVTGFLFENPLGFGSVAVPPLPGAGGVADVASPFQPEHVKWKKGSGKLSG